MSCRRSSATPGGVGVPSGRRHETRPPAMADGEVPRIRRRRTVDARAVMAGIRELSYVLTTSFALCRFGNSQMPVLPNYGYSHSPPFFGGGDYPQ